VLVCVHGKGAGAGLCAWEARWCCFAGEEGVGGEGSAVWLTFFLLPPMVEFTCMLRSPHVQCMDVHAGTLTSLSAPPLLTCCLRLTFVFGCVLCVCRQGRC
jgi:hypothetical protein